MWKVRDLQVRKIIETFEGYLLYGKIENKIYKFLIKESKVFVKDREEWKALPRRISEKILFKFLQFHSSMRYQ